MGDRECVYVNDVVRSPAVCRITVIPRLHADCDLYMRHRGEACQRAVVTGIERQATGIYARLVHFVKRVKPLVGDLPRRDDVAKSSSAPARLGLEQFRELQFKG